MNRKNARDSEEGFDGGSRIGAIAVLVIGLVGFVYAAVLVASRTEGVRAYVEEQLEQAVGWPLSVPSAYVSFGLNVVCEGLSVEGGLVAGRPGLQAEKLILKVSPWQLWRGFERAIRRVEIEDAYVAIARDEHGLWQPLSLAAVVRRIGGWLGAELPAIVAEDSSRRIEEFLFSKPLRLRKARVVWYGDRDTLLELRGVGWQNEMLRVADREFMYRTVTVAEALFRDRDRLGDLRLEFIQTPERTIVLHAEEGKRGRRPESDSAARSAAAPPDEMSVLRQVLSDAARP